MRQDDRRNFVGKSDRFALNPEVASATGSSFLPRTQAEIFAASVIRLDANDGRFSSVAGSGRIFTETTQA
jgi:hypothetical protein